MMEFLEFVVMYILSVIIWETCVKKKLDEFFDEK